MYVWACLRFKLEQKNNGAIQKGVLSCFISSTWVSVCVSVPFIIHGQWLSWSVPPISRAFVWHGRYKKVWINMKSRCGCLQNGILYSCNFFLVNTATYNTKAPKENNTRNPNQRKGQDVQFCTSKTPLSSMHDMCCSHYVWMDFP